MKFHFFSFFGVSVVERLAKAVKFLAWVDVKLLVVVRGSFNALVAVVDGVADGLAVRGSDR
jgi:NCAIR mutase (PurE)-related protein